MKEIEDLFSAVENDYDAFRNLAMLIMTILVNKGILAIHWDLHTQQFCFTVSDYCDCEDHYEEEEDLQIDPEEILRKMGLRTKKKDDGPK